MSSFKIQPPPYFQTPNDLVDHWMPLLKEGEIRILLVVFRKTFGWQKQRDYISLSQFEKLTGMTRSAVSNSIKSLVEKGIIRKETMGKNGTQQSYYELTISEDSNNSYQCETPTPPSPSNPPPPVFSEDPQKTSIQKTSIQKTSLREIFFGLEIYQSNFKKLKEICDKFSEDQILRAIAVTEEKCSSTNKNAKWNYLLKVLESPPKKKLSPYEELAIDFKNGKLYNNAECSITPKSIAFHRGMRHEEVSFQFFSWEKLFDLCNGFGIKYKRKS